MSDWKYGGTTSARYSYNRRRSTKDICQPFWFANRLAMTGIHLDECLLTAALQCICAVLRRESTVLQGQNPSGRNVVRFRAGIRSPCGCEVILHRACRGHESAATRGGRAARSGRGAGPCRYLEAAWALRIGSDQRFQSRLAAVKSQRQAASFGAALAGGQELATETRP